MAQSNFPSITFLMLSSPSQERIKKHYLIWLFSSSPFSFPSTLISHTFISNKSTSCSTINSCSERFWKLSFFKTCGSFPKSIAPLRFPGGKVSWASVPHYLTLVLRKFDIKILSKCFQLNE